MKFFILICYFFFFVDQISSQEFNRIDDNGFKQGSWKKNYDWGGLKYEGEFIDNKEVGFFFFYDKKGRLFSKREYINPGDTSNVTIYMPSGKIEAEGKFKGKVKIGLWKYFSDSGYLLFTEEYVNGIKNGKEIVFYSDSSIFKSIKWENNFLRW